ncbi:5-(carboxyamino)imidazole ribonucleotide synthase [Deinococcus yavapaiensis]|uniref:N5-carboxyaminoimidazole ribonucleotide synthase n=1 Tax=Deinococcus yavapaiensis KR-236 TaxID=694435 RepID=A0A318SAR5_9DEIO|nr:5-(carboxyamino)imidazole ribonucleotide synthase [Deinococcus yavapaiensis]PYE53628.1 5-(carboxyamino)imidazole ribonucleotide synthase [Deinococcus yavapaiensis KR-236]
MKRTLGILGGGQLAQMLAAAALPLGVRCVVLEPDEAAPARLVARHLRAAYTNEAALADLASCDAVTLEFENVPVEALAFLTRRVPVRPAPRLFEISRHRVLEKNAVRALGIETAPFVVLGEEDDSVSLAAVGGQGIVKTAEFGYDGKGQARVRSVEELRVARKAMNFAPSILEGLVDFVREVSVSVARSPSGEVTFSGLVENRHANGILHESVWPASSEASVASRAREIARTVAEAWELEGLLTLEFFELRSGELLVNEIAPRVHNSGHLTQDGGGPSQFEAQVRAVLDLPMLDFAPRGPSGMVNVLGWEGAEPDWSEILRLSGARLHLYHKENRPGRKLGHVNVTGSTPQEVAATMARVRNVLYTSANVE